MSAKARSEALRKILAQNIEQSAVTPAPLTVTGAGAVPTGLPNADIAPTEVMTPDSGILAAKDHVEPAPGELPESIQGDKVDVSPPPVTLESLTIAQTVVATIPVRQEPTAIPRPEKLSVLLGASELAILERFHEDARGAGIKMRKGGNPSLFVRAALRLLDQVGAQNADEWARIVAGTLQDAR